MLAGVVASVRPAGRDGSGLRRRRWLMSPGGERCRPSTSCRCVASRCGRGWPRRRRSDVGRQRRQGAGAGRGWVGGSRRRDDFIGMVVSTGVGGGIVLDGRLLDGAAGNAGHIGHVIVEPDGRPLVWRAVPRGRGVGHGGRRVTGRRSEAGVDVPPAYGDAPSAGRWRRWRPPRPAPRRRGRLGGARVRRRLLRRRPRPSSTTGPGCRLPALHRPAATRRRRPAGCGRRGLARPRPPPSDR